MVPGAAVDDLNMWSRLLAPSSDVSAVSPTSPIPSPTGPANEFHLSVSPPPFFPEMLLPWLSKKALEFCFSLGPVLLSFCNCSLLSLPPMSTFLLGSIHALLSHHTLLTPRLPRCYFRLAPLSPLLSSLIAFMSQVALDHIQDLSTYIPNPG